MSKKAKKNWIHQVKQVASNTKIVDYAAKAFPILGSKSAVKKALSAERLLLNGKPAVFSDRLENGDQLELQGTGVHKVKKYNLDLDIAYEDDYLLIANKPGGIAVNGNRFKTVENALAEANQNNQQPDALPRPVAVHRIDVPTNGLVMLAKTKTAQIKLGKAFQKNKIKKEYIAVVHGQPPAKGRIDEPIDGKEALTDFEILQTVPSQNFEQLSLLKLKPVTGRTHQLRIHLKNAGHFIVGDKMYAEENKTILGKGVLLCACRLQFHHPITSEQLDIRIDPPAKFKRVLSREKKRFGV